ncbi:MAG TPA: hypothetical protein VIW68_10900, partial [Candidatus Sulfotelmatobacter sp.]
RGIALALFVVLHYGLGRALAVAVPLNMIGALQYVQGAIFVFFALIYVYLAWDMLTAFLPRLKVLGTVDAKNLESDSEP